MEDNFKVVATEETGEKKSSASEKEIQLHPLVILNISDHSTRSFSSKKKEESRVLGALFGIQDGLNTHIFDSSEIPFTVKNSNNEEAMDIDENSTQIIQIDQEYLKKRTELVSQVYPNFELLGWYSVGEKVVPSDLAIHKQIMEFNENPLYLLLNISKEDDDPNTNGVGNSVLPVSIFESELHLVNNNPTMLFVKTNFKIETLEAERIAVNHVAKISPNVEGPHSALISNLEGTRDSISVLNQRIRVLYQALKATKDGKVAVDHCLLRKISSICNQLPAVTTEEFQKDFFKEYNDTMLVSYLASITSGINRTNTIIDKVAPSKDLRRRSSGGL